MTLIELPNGFASNQVDRAKDMHSVPSGYTTLSVKDLVKERISLIHECPSISASELRSSVWGQHCTTHTVQYKEEDGVSFFEDEHLFGNPDGFDYENVHDGGVPIRDKDYELPQGRRRISAKELDSIQGGNLSLDELKDHPFAVGLGLEKSEMEDYVEVMKELDDRFTFCDPGKGSIWLASDMKPGHTRMYGLGFWGMAFYPQNPETKGYTVILRKS